MIQREQQTSKRPQESKKYISLFSGALGLDLGLEQAGLETAVCVEIDAKACMSIRQNRPEIPVIERNIEQITTSEILESAGLRVGEAFAVVGGPPCQSFSTGGLRQSITDRRGSLFADFVRIVAEAQPKYFIFENVAQLVTAAVKHRPIAERPGKRWHLSSYKDQTQAEGDVTPLTDDEQAGSALHVMLDAFDALGYSLTFGVLNAADYGVPQKRLRFILLGSRVQRNVPLPQPTHSADFNKDGLPSWRTLKDALINLNEETPLHPNYTIEFRRLFDQVPPGGNWRNLPPDLQREALGNAYESGGGKTGFFRRLSWSEPAPTILGKPNRKSSAVCHPDYTRPLTVRESARLQGFPDDWQFVGSMHDQFLQIGNAVPVDLGRSIGRALLKAYSNLETTLDANEEIQYLHHWRQHKEEMLEASLRVTRAAARNKRTRKTHTSTPLFNDI